MKQNGAAPAALFALRGDTVRTLELSPRLHSVAELVPEGARFADVGTDHAYLPVWLLQQGIIRRAVVSDLRQGPLDRARSTAEKYDLTQQMDFRLCDGLAGITPEEADTIAIAGMGGETVADILAAAPWTLDRECLLLLQPMSAQPFLRQWLQGHGYSIRREVLSREGDTIYTAFQVCAGHMKPLTPAEQWAGRQSRGEDAPLRTDYLDRLLRQTARALEGLRRSSRQQDSLRLEELEQVHRGLKDMREEWLSWQR